MSSHTRDQNRSYPRPQAVKSIKQWLRMVYDCEGEQRPWVSIFYELMTERLSLRVLPADSPYNWGSCYYAL